MISITNLIKKGKLFELQKDCSDTPQLQGPKDGTGPGKGPGKGKGPNAVKENQIIKKVKG